jgi:pimeloyl-ACP methyl ester carboxylesterase
MGMGSLSVGVLGISAYTAVRLAKPPRLTNGEEPPPDSFERVSFPSADGLTLRGWLLPGRRGLDTVILCHGFQTSRREMLPLAMALRERGHHVLLFDFRGHGESDGHWSSCGAMETRDLEGAVRYVLSHWTRLSDRIGVVGFSMGGAVAIMTAARMPEIRAVVSDSSFATLEDAAGETLRRLYHLPRYPVVSVALWLAERLVGCRRDEARPLDHVGRIAPRPILLIHGTEDGLVPLSQALLLYEAAGEPKQLWTVAGAGHVAARLLDFDGYVERVDRFLREALSD